MNYFEVLSENNWESVLINTKVGKTLLELHLCQNPTTSIERDFNRMICLNLGRTVVVQKLRIINLGGAIFDSILMIELTERTKECQQRLFKIADGYIKRKSTLWQTFFV
mmetsp:Transcript_15535/g.20256  ORF Transcript_15535/g.20256 Transcript_15535/m.20256 type:complete len:109 (-) Transcript_15535:273-599(-)